MEKGKVINISTGGWLASGNMQGVVGLKVDYLIICIICDTDLVNKLTLQMYTLHKYK